MKAPRFEPGDRVVLRTTDEHGGVNVEKGVVVWTWLNEQEIHDCYVAFFGADWPRPGVEPKKPYVLRYYDASLEPADEAEAPSLAAMSSRHYTLHPDERKKIAAYLEPGAHLDQVCGPDALREWSVVHREPGRVLIEHWNLALAWVEVGADERVLGHRLVEGEEARETRARHGRA